MVEFAQKIEGVYGARMTGGGFGGSTVNLVAAEACRRVSRACRAGYEERTRIKPEIYVCTLRTERRKLQDRQIHSLHDRYL